MKLNRLNLTIYLILALVFVHVIIIYPSLPDSIPTHWGITGEIDGWGEKSSIWFLYGVVWAVHILNIVLPKIDPRKDNYKRHAHSYDIFRIMIVIFLASMIELTIFASFNPEGVNVSRVLFVMVSILFIILGNYMPKLKHNYTFGIKTPWTLASEAVWIKTHRFCAIPWIVLGIFNLIFSLFNPTAIISFILLMVSIFTLVGLGVIYSYILFKKESI